MKDFYGNPEQIETPTTIILEKRKGQKEASDSHFKFGAKVFPNVTREGVVAYLKLAAIAVEVSKAERFRFEFSIEEVEE